MNKLEIYVSILLLFLCMPLSGQVKVYQDETVKNRAINSSVAKKTNFKDAHKGYIIKNNGQKVHGVFKRASYYDNPEVIKFKSDVDKDFKNITVSHIKEFKIGESVNYVSALVKIDMSSDKVSNLSYLKKPEFEDKTLFLKVLLEGNASLYVYYKGGLKKYFYKIENGEIVQLIYKRYLKNGKDVSYNNHYKQQISSSFFDCKDIKQSKYTNINYNLNSLAKIFTSYNACKGSGTTKLYKRESRLDFSLMPRVGMYLTKVSIENSDTPSLGADFGASSGLKYGLFGQARFSHWTLFLGFETNNKIKKTISIETSSPGLRQDVTLDYKAFEIIAGLKYSFFLDENSGVNIFAGLVNESRSSFEIDYELSKDIEEIQSDSNLMLGLGYNYKKFNIDVKMNVAKSFFPSSSKFDSKVTDVSFMFGYEIF